MNPEDSRREGVYHRFPSCPFCQSYRVEPRKSGDRSTRRTPTCLPRYRCLDCGLSFHTGTNRNEGPGTGKYPPKRLLSEIRPYFFGLLLIILFLLLISLLPTLF